MSNKILLAEDDPDLRAVLSLRLKQKGYAVTECRDGAELVAELADYLREAPQRPVRKRYDLVISDVRMPGFFGLSVIEGARACHEFPPTILITAFGDAETHDRAQRSGVCAVLDKPFETGVLLNKVEEVLSRPTCA